MKILMAIQVYQNKAFKYEKEPISKPDYQSSVYIQNKQNMHMGNNYTCTFC